MVLSKYMKEKTITISVQEYQSLQKMARRFEQAMAVLVEQDDVFLTPSVKNTKSMIVEMKKTKKYSRAFLKSVEQGLRESSFFGV